jgi:hypothetical protein
MKYDYAINRMPGSGFPSSYDQNEKQQRIWQVVEIERDDMGSPVKDLEVRNSHMTYDEAFSLCNELRQQLNKVEREKQ